MPKLPPGHRPLPDDHWPVPVMMASAFDVDRNLHTTPSQVTMGLAEAANVAQVAVVLPEGELRSELEASAAAFVDAVLDDYCGTRPPWPGPSPWAMAVASALSELANTYQAGFLRDELLRITARVMQKSAGHRKP